MKSTFIALTFATLTLMWSVPAALAQEATVARGRVTALDGSSMRVKVGDREMKFSVDKNTIVQARGGSTKTRQAEALGRPGPHLADVLRVGQGVEINYKDMGGDKYASVVRAVPNLSTNSRSTASAATATKVSSGVVKSIGPDSITINGSSGGGGTFLQTFTFDSTTKVVAKGAGTASASRGGKAPLSEMVKNGDTVSVSYHEQGNALHASNVHVTLKAAVR
jgi:Cu/Ag efflux protein CusF